MLTLRTPGAEALRDAVAQLQLEELAALPGLSRAYTLFEADHDSRGCLLTASYAVLALAAAYADFRTAATWAQRLKDASRGADALAVDEELLFCGATVAATVIVDTGGYDSPGVREAIEQALHLMTDRVQETRIESCYVVARALLEYSGTQAEPDLYHRVVNAMASSSGDSSASALSRARFQLFETRCAVRFSAFEPIGTIDDSISALLAQAESAARDHDLAFLLFDVRVVQLTIAIRRQDTAAASGLIDQMSRVLDRGRPNCTSGYYWFKARIHLMRDETAPAIEAATHSVRAAVRAGCSPSDRTGNHLLHSLALLAGGQVERAQSEIRELISTTSGRIQATLQCTLAFVEAWGAALAGDREYRQLLQSALQQAEELNWPLFLHELPRISAQIASDALRFRLATELVTRVIVQRKLVPPPDADDRWPWPLKLYVLGRFAVFRGASEIHLSGRAHKQAELLKLLAVCRPEGERLSWFADALWPDSDGDDGLRNLDVTLTRLRKLLAVDDAVVLRSHSLSLNPRVVWLDVRAFDATTERVHADLTAQEPKQVEVESAIDRVLELYRADLLAADAYPWIMKARTKCRGRLVRALLETGLALEQRAQWAKAISLYERGLEVDALEEELYRRQIACELRRGNQAAALRVYRSCVESLRSLGVAPSDETKAIVRDLNVSASREQADEQFGAARARANAHDAGRRRGGDPGSSATATETKKRRS